jgi:hypothetical protein
MPLVLPEFPLQTTAKARLVVCNANDTDPTLEYIKAHGYVLEFVANALPVSVHLRTLISTADVLLFDITTSGRDILSTIQEVIATIGIGSYRPRVLCFSSRPRNPQFVLRIQ